MKNDFTETDIEARTNRIIDAFVNYPGDNNPLK